ncbi:UNVERIFIED_CONTAM: Sorbin and SH3 domain-containing protein 2 [Siphonaria sp. JEL0065]|nr:Sorbin and SH3 domain-containing protein 2 [Siphonaria sp. JEL0065]
MSCISLAQSTMCAGFKQFSAWVNPQLGVTDITSFDNYIRESVNTSPSVIGFGYGMVNQYGCPGWTGAGLRYHLSAVCALVVAQGNLYGTEGGPPCNQPAAANPLCLSTYNAYLSSFATVQANALICPDGGASVQSQYVYAFDAIKTQLSDSASCLSFEATDSTNCGFASSTEATAFCATSTDSCCALVSTTAVPTGTASVPSTSSLSKTSTSSASAATTTTAASSGLSSQTIIYIAAGGGGGLLLIIAIVVFMCCFKRKKQANNTYTVGEKGGLQEKAPAYGKTQQAIHGYSPAQSDELAIQVGDAIVIKTEYDDGWAFGFNTITHQEGYFPVEVLSNGNNFDVHASKRVSSYYGGNGYDANTQSVYDAPNTQSVYENTQSVYDNTQSYYDNTQSVYDNSQSIYDNTQSVYVPAGPASDIAQLGPDQAIYPFVPSRDDELALKAGDRVHITKAFDDGWCYGKHVGNNREGYFPFDCLASYETGHKQTAPKAGGAGKKQRISSIYESEYGDAPATDKVAQVVFDYTPLNHDELALRTGERVEVKHAYDGKCIPVILRNHVD